MFIRITSLILVLALCTSLLPLQAQERDQRRMRTPFFQGGEADEDFMPDPRDPETMEEFEGMDGPRAERQAREQLRIVEQFLSMPPEHLARVRRAIERIERMEQHEREALRGHLRKMREMRDGSIVYLRFIAPAVDPNDRDLLRKEWIEMPSERRRELGKKLIQMEESERRKFLNTLAVRLREEQVAGEDTSEETVSANQSSDEAGTE